MGILFVARGNVTKGIVSTKAAAKTRKTAVVMGNVAAGSVILTVLPNIAFAVPRRIFALPHGESPTARNTSHAQKAGRPRKIIRICYPISSASQLNLDNGAPSKIIKLL